MGKKAWALIAVVVILCSVLAIMLMPDDSPKYEVKPTYKDVSYGPDVRNKLDIYIPETGGSGTHPMFMYLHGGGWSSGDKAEGSGLAEGLLENGCAVVSVNYRFLSDEQGNIVGCEEMLHDIGLAVGFIMEHSSEYRIKTGKMAIGGSSAGAHLSLMYAYSVTDKPIEIAFVMSFSGPTDLTDPNYYNGTSESWVVPLIKKLAKIDTVNINLSDADTYEKLMTTSPIGHVDQNSPPTILAQGMKDSIVPWTNAERMEDRTTSVGQTNHDFFYFQNSGHSLDSPDDNAVRDAFFGKLGTYLYTYLIL